MNDSNKDLSFLIENIKTELIKRKKHISDKEWSALNNLIEGIVNPIPNIPPALWITIMSKVVATSVELVLIRDGRALLTFRDDKYFTGLHFPGTFISPGETLIEAAKRCGQKELGIKINSAEPFGKPIIHSNITRFDCSSILLQCTSDEKPKSGEWHNKCPESIIKEQEKYWQYIEPLLRNT